MELNLNGKKMKKKLPLKVLKILEKFVTLQGNSFSIIEPDSFLLKVIDSDPNSDFYFNVEKYKSEKGLKLLISRKPVNDSTTDGDQVWIGIENLGEVFDKWLALLNEYERVKSFFDDPILNSFFEDYYSEFELLEDDVEIKPFSPKQILLLDEHLDYIESRIENHQTDANKERIQTIKKDIIELRDNLTTKPKAWVLKKFSMIFAKLTKEGTKFMKEFISEAKKEVIKQGIKAIIEAISH